MSYEDSLSSQYLTSSISSLSSARAQSSHIARTYRQAAQLFLTRRLYEALSTIHPIISPEAPDSPLQQEGQSDHDAAPVAFASKTTRVKVWSFYLTLLNAIIELGPEEGKLVFGSTKWRELAAYARQGTVWDLVVRQGYQGNDGALLELYTLHVLPQNDEWDYARDFISMSEVLDDERRDAFLQALHTLKEEKALDGIREKELQRRQDEEMQQRRMEDERRRKEEARADQDRKRREAEERPRTAGSQNRTPSTSSNPRAGQGNRNTAASKAKPAQKKATPPSPRVYRSVFTTVQAAILNAGKSVTQNPMGQS
ncbi:unnamed protein product [Aureobasidium pullulans]|nr:unnamed protein product [Aureobasidium pullulans]